MQIYLLKPYNSYFYFVQVWTLKDKVWFNQRVVNDQFVSIVKEVEQTSDGVVLTLELIDTSNPMEDVYVLNQLLERE